MFFSVDKIGDNRCGVCDCNDAILKITIGDNEILLCKTSAFNLVKNVEKVIENA